MRIFGGGGIAGKLSSTPNLELDRHVQLGSVCGQTWRRNCILSLYREELQVLLYVEAGSRGRLGSCG